MPTLSWVRSLTALLAAVIIASPAARAEAQSVRLSGTATLTTPAFDLLAGGFTFSFVLPQTPVPFYSEEDGFILQGVSGDFAQGALTQTLIGELYVLGGELGGGFDFFSLDGSDDILLLSATGPVIFSSNPQSFVTGVYQPTGAEPGADGEVNAFAITDVSPNSTVPEPSSAALLAIGAGVLIVARRSARIAKSSELLALSS